MPTLATSMMHSIKNLSHSNEKRKKKGIQIGKEEIYHYLQMTYTIYRKH